MAAEVAGTAVRSVQFSFVEWAASSFSMLISFFLGAAFWGGGQPSRPTRIGVYSAFMALAFRRNRGNAKAKPPEYS